MIKKARREKKITMDLKHHALIFKQDAQARRAELRTLEQKCVAAEKLAEAAEVITGESKIVNEALDRVSEANEQLMSIQNKIPALAAEAQKQQSIAAQAIAQTQAARAELSGLQDELAEARSIIARAEEKEKILEQLRA